MAVGLRERKKDETRRAIARVALELALEHGPDDVTVEAIAAAADVSPRTVFNHFGSKDQAILGIDPARRMELAEAVRGRPAGETPVQALGAALVDLLTSEEDTGRMWRQRARLVAAHPDLRAAQSASTVALEQHLAAAIGERLGLDPAADPYPSLVVAVVLAASRITLERSATAGRTRLRRDLDRALAALEQGLVPPR